MAPSSSLRAWWAGAVVTLDEAAWTIVAGNPARPIRRRFSKDRAAARQRLARWDRDRDRRRAAAFVAKYG